jgi:phage protein D
MSALIEVEVTNDDENGDGFQITFTLGKDAVSDYSLLKSGAVDSFTRVIVGVLMGASPEVLIDGVITHHQITPDNDPGMSTLTVTGRDISTMLDLEERNEKYPNRPDSVIVAQVLAGYAQYGLIPQPTPTTDMPIELQRVPRQQETDLRFIQRLAKRNGFVFYVEPLTFGTSTAYWGPTKRTHSPQPALNIDMGSSTNISSLHFTQDALAPVEPKGKFIDPILGMSLPIPPLPSLRVPPLAGSPTPAKRTVLMRNTANQSQIQAALSALSTATNAPDSVRGTGELDAVLYGGVLRARQPVGVRGAGFSYDGIYVVHSVTHRIKRGAYTQSFAISREGTGSLSPVVRA